MRFTALVLAGLLAATAAVAVEKSRDTTQASRDMDNGFGPEIIRDCAQCPELKVLPAGNFMMGAPAAQTSELTGKSEVEQRRIQSESPQKKITFAKAFAIGRFEITRDQFAAFVKATGYKTVPNCMIWAPTLDRSANGKSWTDAGIPQGDDHPAVCLSKDDAEAYVAWLTQVTGRKYALPTEAQWEYALRAGGTSRYPWGDKEEDACLYANVADATFKAADPSHTAYACNDTFLYTAPVGLRQPNAWGLYDMVGNAWEWVADCWTPNHETVPADGTPVTAASCA